MTTPAATMPQPAPAAPPSPVSRPSRYGLIFGIVAAVLTLGAIALAVFAPALTSAPALEVPQGWQQVYSDNPGNTPALWNNAENSFGCSLPATGLSIGSDSTCVFTPANNATLSNGVLVVARLAPAADVALAQDGGILLDNTFLVIVSQQGEYTICRTTCDPSPRSETPVITGSTVAWHADAFVPNEIALLYNSDQQLATFYVNGQYVDQISTGLGDSPTIALTTSSSGEALFTHVSIYAASRS